MKNGGKAALCAALLALLCGCMFRSPSELYQLPQRSPGYEKLTVRLDEMRQALEQEYSTTAEPAIIYSGNNTSNIQLQDMDGDGIPETAVTFLRLPSAEHPLRICFFSRQGDDDYLLRCMVEGDGAAINSVEYVDLSGDGWKELVVSWQGSASLYQLGVYALDLAPRDSGRAEAEGGLAMRFAEGSELMLTNYSGYSLVDIDQDELTELAVVQLDAAESSGVTDLYGWRGGAFVRIGSVRLSGGIKSILRVRANYVAPDTRALYVTGTLVDGGQTTDILCWRDGEAVNLTLDPETGVSRETVRNFGNISPTDVNGDGILELPRPRPLPSAEEGMVGEFWLIDWKQYSASGSIDAVFTTYHNRDDSWFFVVPEDWADEVNISRDDSVSGERAVIFSHWKGPDQEAVPFLGFYKLSGINRNVRAARRNRFLLSVDESVIYAAAFLGDEWDCGLNETDVLERFYRIMDGWASDS